MSTAGISLVATAIESLTHAEGIACGYRSPPVMFLMGKRLIMTTSNKSTEASRLERLRHVLATRDALGIAEELAHLDPQERATGFRLLSPERALEVFQYLDAAHQEERYRSPSEAVIVPVHRAREGEPWQWRF
jgi:hypothetical protein